ncbi:hypothetical protein [Novosphingobium sp.]|uniref:hypothetical protein n=1 Tax=Novosphingobium sp. TaxID=1874826 RepID=UPI001EB173A4|nr:hypothetical protein [Novosphingobium sp.]MBK9011821.1 hypothetical protein [Novosphingobium sp.]
MKHAATVADDVFGPRRLELIPPAFIDPPGNHRPASAVVFLNAFPAQLDVAIAEVAGTWALGALAAWQCFAGISQGLCHAPGMFRAGLRPYRRHCALAITISHGAMMLLELLRRPAFDVLCSSARLAQSNLDEILPARGDQLGPAAFVNPSPDNL